MRSKAYVFFSAVLLAAAIAAYFWVPFIRKYSEISQNGFLINHLDWLLILLFAFMTTIVIAGADIKSNLPFIIIGLAGGLAIEGWGTQTELWVYYTKERPPFWVIPAWPTVTLVIDFIVKKIDKRIPELNKKFFVAAYYIIAIIFLILMVNFALPQIDKSTTILALAVCVTVFAAPVNYKLSVIIFLTGGMLGYFLEFWGTTRHCWNYYTGETPPLFPVLSHGMASLVFWRTHLILDSIIRWFAPNYQGHWGSQNP